MPTKTPVISCNNQPMKMFGIKKMTNKRREQLLLCGTKRKHSDDNSKWVYNASQNKLLKVREEEVGDENFEY